MASIRFFATLLCLVASINFTNASLCYVCSYSSLALSDVGNCMTINNGTQTMQCTGNCSVTTALGIGAATIARLCVPTCIESASTVLGLQANVSCCKGDLCNSANLDGLSVILGQSGGPPPAPASSPPLPVSGAPPQNGQPAPQNGQPAPQNGQPAPQNGQPAPSGSPGSPGPPGQPGQPGQTPVMPMPGQISSPQPTGTKLGAQGGAPLPGFPLEEQCYNGGAKPSAAMALFVAVLGTYLLCGF